MSSVKTRARTAVPPARQHLTRSRSAISVHSQPPTHVDSGSGDDDDDDEEESGRGSGEDGVEREDEEDGDGDEGSRGEDDEDEDDSHEEEDDGSCYNDDGVIPGSGGVDSIAKYLEHVNWRTKVNRRVTYLCPILGCPRDGPFGDYASIARHLLADHPNHVNAGARASHPYQPFVTHPAILVGTGTLLLSFGGNNPAEHPHVLWCETCRSALVVDEFGGHWEKHEPKTRVPRAFLEDEILKEFPELMKTAAEISDIHLGPVGSMNVLAVDQLLDWKGQVQCPSPFCGYVCAEDTFKKKHSAAHKNAGHHRPTNPHPVRAQSLGSRRNWPQFPVLDVSSSSVPRDRERVIRAIIAGFTTPRVVRPRGQKTDIVGTHPLYRALGWASVVDSFSNKRDALETLRTSTIFQKGEHINILISYVSNYVGSVALSCLDRSRLATAAMVRTPHGYAICSIIFVYPILNQCSATDRSYTADV